MASDYSSFAGAINTSEQLNSSGSSHPQALTGRVEEWRGALRARFHPPPRQTQHADFPHYAFSVNFV